MVWRIDVTKGEHIGDLLSCLGLRRTVPSAKQKESIFP